MPRVLGVRAESDAFSWAVVEGSEDDPVIVAQDKAKVPVAHKDPEALMWCRERLHYLIEHYGVDTVAVRAPENIARGTGEGFRKRLRIEGVLLEASRARVSEVHLAALTKASARLGTKSAKHYVEHGDIRGLDISSFNMAIREAILFAVAFLHKKQKS